MLVTLLQAADARLDALLIAHDGADAAGQLLLIGRDRLLERSILTGERRDIGRRALGDIGNLCHAVLQGILVPAKLGHSPIELLAGGDDRITELNLLVLHGAHFGGHLARTLIDLADALRELGLADVDL